MIICAGYDFHRAISPAQKHIDHWVAVSRTLERPFFVSS